MTIDIPLALDIPQEKLSKMVSGNSDGEEYQIMETTVSSKDRCQLKSTNSTTFKFHLHTRYSVKPVAIRKGKAEQEMKNKTVSHYYQLTNIGPSVSNKPYHFSIATPLRLNANLTGEPDSSINCIKKLEKRINNNDKKRMLLGNIMGSTKCTHIDTNIDSNKAIPTEFSRYDCIIGKKNLKEECHINCI